MSIFYKVSNALISNNNYGLAGEMLVVGELGVLEMYGRGCIPLAGRMKGCTPVRGLRLERASL